MASGPRLHRVILHLRHGAAERVTIRTAAELAQMLGVALHGVFVEDAALPELATLPFIREFRLSTGSWQRLDRQRLAVGSGARVAPQAPVVVEHLRRVEQGLREQQRTARVAR